MSGIQLALFERSGRIIGGNINGGEKMQLKDSEEVFTYIGVKECGCAVAIAVDKPQYTEQTREFINECLDDGLHIERVLLEQGKNRLQSDCLCYEDNGSAKVLEAAGQQRMFER